MPEQLPNLSLPLLMPSQAQKHVTHNEALRILDTLTQLSVLSDTTATPPATPSEGDRYLVAAGGTGDWDGRDGVLASFDQGHWVFHTPQAGWRSFVIDQAKFKIFDGQAWHTLGSSLFENLLGVGIGVDTANAPFSAKLNAALWTALYAADGGTGDLIQTLNKEGPGDDAGFVFQTGFATRAILGLFGSDQLRLAVTDDGANFRDGLTVDSATGIVDQPGLPRFSGSTNFDNFGPRDQWKKIEINTLAYNEQGVFDAATGLFTVPADGLYQMGGHLLYGKNNSNGARINVRMVKNGSEVLPGSYGGITSGHSNGTTYANTHACAPLAAGDTVELQGMFSDYSGYFQADDTTFWGYKIG